mmetsp:Transcript_17994/g.45576  ORF Transcript_17994/g.45576 Transcript_17994/m.45576 type:complete len:107 (-) Transcript_17994:11-331(-)
MRSRFGNQLLQPEPRLPELPRSGRHRPPTATTDRLLRRTSRTSAGRAHTLRAPRKSEEDCSEVQRGTGADRHALSFVCLRQLVVSRLVVGVLLLAAAGTAQLFNMT